VKRIAVTCLAFVMVLIPLMAVNCVDKDSDEDIAAVEEVI